VLHDVLERTQEVLLEAEAREFPLLEKLHGELTQAVDREEGDGLIVAASDHVEVVA